MRLLRNNWFTQKADSHFRLLVGVLSAATMALATGYYWVLIRKLGRATDVQAHVAILYKACLGQGAVAANFGFYRLVQAASGFSCDLSRLLNTAVVVVAVAWGGLVSVSSYAGIGLLKRRALAELPVDDATQKVTGLMAAVCSCLVFPLPLNTADWYLGMLPPNVFHNSTILSAMPFSVLAFASGAHRLSQPAKASKSDDLLLSLLLVVGGIFKPSYAFAFLPAYALLFALKFRSQPAQLLRLTLVLLPVVLLVAGQLAWTNHHPKDTLHDASVLAVGFPAGWHTFVPGYGIGQVLACMAGSFLVPVSAYSLRPDWLKRPAHQLAVLSLIAGLGIFMLIYETGYRALHGNFIWQVVAANHVLHWLVCLESFSWAPANASQQRKRMLLVGLLAIEVLSGIAYLIKALFLGI
ncbi:hypothetical protein [Hymenobacter negativus]|uniref:Uncharacterized protein n=1 Tax=Hymenobacter negativus TaxID=2795026 RepID=A0ABS3QCL2_9BACT|nr:hypothetical protein [Hymenobacter negativus]MBO2008982.1 hypothetical protein [Hymenobacter negativus]